MKELEQLEREEVEMVEIELRVGKEKKIVGATMLGRRRLRRGRKKAQRAPYSP